MAASTVAADGSNIPPQATWESSETKMEESGDAIPLNGRTAPSDDHRPNDAAQVTGHKTSEGTPAVDGADGSTNVEQSEGAPRGEKLIKVLVWSLCNMLCISHSPLSACLSALSFLTCHTYTPCHLSPLVALFTAIRWGLDCDWPSG